jgi:acyl CoA:acetate/3-ketoacid CoA transferase
MDKTFATAKDALTEIQDGAVLGIGGFFAAGISRMSFRQINVLYTCYSFLFKWNEYAIINQFRREKR